MKRIAYLLSISLIAGSILVGCGSSSSSTPSATATPATTATPAATATPDVTATPTPDASATPLPGGECPGYLPC